MIPIKDYNPTSRRSIVVPLIIAANVIVFLFIQPTFASGETGKERQAEFTFCHAAIPFELTHHESLGQAVLRGDIQSPPGLNLRFLAARCRSKSWILSVFEAMFMHGGFLHIAGNMLFLWVFGNNVEDRLGYLKFTVFYLLCGVVATFSQTYVARSSIVPMVGASGAIAGVLGAYIVMYPRARVRNLIFFVIIFFFVDLPAWIVLGFWFLLQVFSTFAQTAQGAGVAYMAHIGGFIAGLVLLLLFRPRPAERLPDYVA